MDKKEPEIIKMSMQLSFNLQNNQQENELHLSDL